MNPDYPQNQPGGVINPTQPQSPPPAGGPAPMAGQDMFRPIMPAQPEPQPQPVGMPVTDPNMQPPAQPGFIPTVPAGQPIQPITKLPTAKKPSKKLPLIIAGSLVGLLVLITVGAVLLSGGDKQPVQQNTNQTQGLEGPQPAAAIDVEQANNAITQDVTGHDNTKDFPDDMLTDQSLGL